MTLNDLWLLLRHYAKWVVAIPLTCMLLTGGYMFVSDHMKERNFTAISVLTVTDPTALLSSTSLSNLMDALAQNEVSSLPEGVSAAEADSDPATQSITFTVAAVNEEMAVAASNDIAAKTAEMIRDSLNTQADNYLSIVDQADEGLLPDDSAAVSAGTAAADRVAALRSCVFTVTEAKEASASASSGVLKYAAVGLLGGLFIVICALALFDSVARPVKGRADIAAVTDLPVLVDGDGSVDGERLWANICFLVATPRSVCVLPVSGEVRKDVSSLIVQAAGRDGVDALKVSDCPPLSTGIAGARVAREADATIVVVRPWEDKAACLRETLLELQIAQANVIGVALSK